MGQRRSRAIAVLDIGKTNVSLCAIDQDGATLRIIERANRVLPGPPYPHFDADSLFQWILDSLSALASDFEIAVIVPATHGACAALIDGNELALPILDYEFDGIHEFDAEYEPMARDFANTHSPDLPAGLNLGRQLFWQQRRFPRDFERAAILPYPQYWAWRLSGVQAWEVTSLGCHTDLWRPQTANFSNLTIANGWDRRFPQRANAWKTLGPITADVAAATGLGAGCAVLAGIHDSNASYFAHRATRADPFCVVSTGTWVVVMAHGGAIRDLRADRDTLGNVDAFGDAVPTARFMGGHEYAEIAGKDGSGAEPLVDDLRAVLELGALALPSFSTLGGPFKASAGRVVGPSAAEPGQRTALAALYCALMTDLCLSFVDARGEVIVEGRLAGNEAYMAALASLRAPQPVFRSRDETGTARGAAMLAALSQGVTPKPAELSRVSQPDGLNLEDARRRWRGLLPKDPGR